MNFYDYTEILGLNYDESDKQNAFINKFKNLIYTWEGDVFPKNAQISFATRLGLEYHPQWKKIYYQDERLQTAWMYISMFDSFNGKVAAISELINTLSLFNQENVCKTIKEIVRHFFDSCHISYRVIEDEDEFFLIPGGDRILNRKEVNEPLESLMLYPRSKEAFVRAIKAYKDISDIITPSEVADYFRKALETFCQEFFNSNKSLENYKSEYGNYLKAQGITKELSGNFETLLQMYTNYNNNNAKHQHKVSTKVLEYIMYQTGNIIRLLVTLKG